MVKQKFDENRRLIINISIRHGMYPTFNQGASNQRGQSSQSGFLLSGATYPVSPSSSYSPQQNQYNNYANNPNSYQPNINAYQWEQEVQYTGKISGKNTELGANINVLNNEFAQIEIGSNTNASHSEAEAKRKQSETIDPESYNQLTYYQFHTINHLFRTIRMSHCQMIRKLPYIQTAINAISYVISTLKDPTSPYQPLLQSLMSKLNYSLSLFTNNEGSVQPSKTYYQIQSWMIIMISVYKCIQDGYDCFARKKFKNICAFFCNEELKNPVACMRWLENNRKEVLELENMEKFMSKASSVIFDIYEHRGSFLKGKQLDEVPNFGLVNLTTLSCSRRKVVNIWISGFLSEDMDKKSHWQQLTQLMPDSEIYAVQWTSDRITNLIKFIGKACFDVLTADKIKTELYKKFSENPFIPAIETAIILGKYLAEMLVKLFPNQFINIVGYSLASQMMLACIQRMIELRRQSMLNNIYLLGGVTDCEQFENALRKAQYPLTIRNCYTANDMVLKHVLSLCKPETKPVGLQEIKPVNGHDIANIDCSQFVSGHLAYMNCFDDVGRVLEMSQE